MKRKKEGNGVGLEVNQECRKGLDKILLIGRNAILKLAVTAIIAKRVGG